MRTLHGSPTGEQSLPHSEAATYTGRHGASARPGTRTGSVSRVRSVAIAAPGHRASCGSTDEDIEKIAELRGTTVEELRQQLHRGSLRVASRSPSTKNGDCTFFDSKTRRCGVYAARPAQCRTWPFWNSNLESRNAWDTMCESCPGAGHGDFVPLAEIERRARVIDV